MQQLHQQVKKHYHYHKQFFPHYFVVVFYTTVFILSIYTLFPPKVSANTIEKHGLGSSIEVSLWGWVKASNLSIKSNYDTPLSAKLHPASNPIKQTLTITPEDLLYPETGYSIEIQTRNWIGFVSKQTLKISTNALPEVALANKFEDKYSIPASTDFQFKLSTDLDPKFFAVVSTPSFDHLKEVRDNTLLIKPKTKLKQGENYNISVLINSTTLGGRILYSDSFGVIDPLVLVLSNPIDSSETVAKQTLPEFIFNKAVNQENFANKVKIEPTLEYTNSWKNETTLVLTPKNSLQTSTKYTVTFDSSLTGIDGSQLLDTTTVVFTTAGKVTVNNFSPVGNSVNPASLISVTFNQPVEQASAQSSFSLTPNVAGSFSWSGNTLVYKTAGLGMLTAYTINLAPGVKSLGGENSSQTFSHKFTTTSERSSTIGYSVKGRAITATYFGTGPKRILLVGTLHGSESNTGNMLNSWISYLRANQTSIGTDRTFIIVPFANPDGRANNFRFNANNVDLNRNFGTPDWQALSYWQNRSYPNGGGSGPFSEPESRALRDLILSQNVTHIITYHSNANMVLGDGIANAFGDWYSNQTGYNRVKGNDEENEDGVSALGYVITGTLEEWATLQGKITLVVEFISQTANEYNRNLPALKGLLDYPI